MNKLQKNKISPLLLTVMLGGLTMIGVFSVDIYFPAFPDMAKYFNISSLELQQSLTAYLVPFALLTLIYGPLSDAIGRKIIVCSGLLLFFLASTACAFAHSFTTIISFRMLQGVAAGAGRSVSRVIVREFFEDKEAQKVLAWISICFGVGPAIAPIIGGYCHYFFGWRGIFGFMSLFSASLLIIFILLLPESHPISARIPFHPKSLLVEIKKIIVHKNFMLTALASGINFCALFLFISSAPAIVIKHWHLSTTEFIWFMGPVVCGMVLAGIVASSQQALSLGRNSLITIGFIIAISAGLLNITLLTLFPKINHMIAVLPIVMLGFGTSISFPAFCVEILDIFPKIRGTAASVQGFIQMILMSITAGIIAPLAQSLAFTLVITATILSCIAYLSYLLGRPTSRCI